MPLPNESPVLQRESFSLRYPKAVPGRNPAVKAGILCSYRRPRIIRLKWAQGPRIMFQTGPGAQDNPLLGGPVRTLDLLWKPTGVGTSHFFRIDADAPNVPNVPHIDV